MSYRSTLVQKSLRLASSKAGICGPLPPSSSVVRGFALARPTGDEPNLPCCQSPRGHVVFRDLSTSLFRLSRLPYPSPPPTAPSPAVCPSPSPQDRSLPPRTPCASHTNSALRPPLSLLGIAASSPELLSNSPASLRSLQPSSLPYDSIFSNTAPMYSSLKSRHFHIERGGTVYAGRPRSPDPHQVHKAHIDKRFRDYNA